MTYPLVSIIIPYRINRGYLNKAIASIYGQTYPGAIEIIESNHDASVSYNLNQGIKAASGTFIKYLCEDDYLPSNSIKDSVEGMLDYDFINGNAVAIYMEGMHAGKHLDYIPKNTNPTFEQLLVYNSIHGGSLMYRRDVFDKIGFFDETIDCAEEYEFNLRCLFNDLKIGYVNSFLYFYRRHGEQKSLGNGVNKKEREFKIYSIKQRYSNKKT
jgi:teichuronic acid biosynthesis glycosyltransferase TuaG